jgi:asparagine synthase (glutamine-hydrolysing)
MCGIAGIAARLRPQDLDQRARAMASTMAHRGPDDEGVALLESGRAYVVLAARRLAIQDCSSLGHQPMRSPATGNALALNGEIYNVDALRSELRARGHAFVGHSDTEVALHAWDEWGERFVDHLRGMFAIAAWDARDPRLLLVRDRLGIKPLYIAQAGGRLAFASEVRTLLASGLVDPAPSALGIASYLSLGAVQDPLTLVDAIESLPPGHLAEWRDGRPLEVRRYWALEDAFGLRSTPPSRREAVERLRAMLEEATRMHLVSDVPLGVFLSGGIDSTAVTALVSAVSNQPPRSVSVVFPQQAYSEERYIRMVSERFGTRHESIELDDATVLDQVPDAVAAMDQPSSDGVNTHIVSRLARQAGLTVALSGLGGDELFGGYPSFADVPRLRTIRRALPGPLGALAAGTLARLGSRSDRQQKLARWLADPAATPSAYALRRELFGQREVDALTRQQTDALQRWQLPPTRERSSNDVSLLELSVYMRNVLLRDSDVMSMAHSLEIRVPLLDHVVVEYAASLPAAWKLRGRKPKPLLVDALADLLPDEVVYRPKMGFTLPFEDWLRGALKRDVENVLCDAAVGGAVAPLLDETAVRDVWRRFSNGQASWIRPWSLYVLKVWGEAHAQRTREDATVLPVG